MTDLLQGDPWADFLDARHRLIHEWLSEGVPGLEDLPIGSWVDAVVQRLNSHDAVQVSSLGSSPTEPPGPATTRQLLEAARARIDAMDQALQRATEELTRLRKVLLSGKVVVSSATPLTLSFLNANVVHEAFVKFLRQLEVPTLSTKLTPSAEGGHLLVTWEGPHPLGREVTERINPWGPDLLEVLREFALRCQATARNDAEQQAAVVGGGLDATRGMASETVGDGGGGKAGT